jgi:hypothetical protein
MKTLRVCLSSDLPGLLDRNPDYLYFTYDKLILYSGQNQLDVNYVIAPELPDIEDQVPGMFYILSNDGSVHRKVDYSDIQVAEIEDASQVSLLKKAGSIYYINSDHRYLDSQIRTLTLPFNDGLYELSVAAKNDAVYDNNTILKFNENSNRFELYGDDSGEFIDFSKPFRGKETDSIKVTVDGPRISAMVKVSKALGNLLKLASDGLYVKTNNLVDRESFDEWVNYVVEFKKHAQDVLDNIDSELQAIQELVTPEAIEEEIMTELRSKYPDIDTALENYQQVVDSLDDIQNNVMEYASSNIISAIERIDDTVKENSNWDDISPVDLSNTPYGEINYYDKLNAYLNSAINNTPINNNENIIDDNEENTIIEEDNNSDILDDNNNENNEENNTIEDNNSDIVDDNATKDNIQNSEEIENNNSEEENQTESEDYSENENESISDTDTPSTDTESDDSTDTNSELDTEETENESSTEEENS